MLEKIEDPEKLLSDRYHVSVAIRTHFARHCDCVSFSYHYWIDGMMFRQYFIIDFSTNFARTINTRREWENWIKENDTEIRAGLSIRNGQHVGWNDSLVEITSKTLKRGWR